MESGVKKHASDGSSDHGTPPMEAVTDTKIDNFFDKRKSMSTITLENVRACSDITMKVRLKDNGVAVDWSGLTDIKALVYSDDQKAVAGRCAVSVDSEDPTVLVCLYAATKPQYLGVNSIIVRAKYMGREKTYDKQAVNIVARTAELEGEQVVLEDPEVTVDIEVTEVDSSLLDAAIAAAFDAADKANEAAEQIPLQVLTEAREATAAANTAAAAANAAGITSVQASIADNEPGTPSVDVALLNKVLSLVFHHLKGVKGDTGATPNIEVGTVTTGEPGTSVIVEMTGTAEAPVLNITIPQGAKGEQGNTGSSVDYSFELVNNLTTDDATKALSAAQGVVLDGKISQLQQDVNVKLLNEDWGMVLTDNKTAFAPDSYFPNPLVVGSQYEVTNMGEVAASLWAYDSNKQGISAIVGSIPAGNTIQFIFNTEGVAYIGGWTNNTKYSIALKRVDFVNKLNTKVDDSYFGNLTLYHKKNAIGDSESFPVKMLKGETYSVKNNESVLCSFTLYKDGNRIGNFSIPAQGNVTFVCPDDVTEVRGYINALVYSVEITRLNGADYYTKQDVSPFVTDLILHDGYIHKNASAGVFPSTVSQYSDPFFVKKGQKVHLEFVDSGTITIIAKYNYYGESNVSTYTRIMTSDDPSKKVQSGVNVYDYVVTEDMYIAVCGAKASFLFYLDTNINYVLKEETEKSFSTNNNANYSVAFKIYKGHRYLVKNTGSVNTSCLTKWSRGGQAIDTILSEVTEDSRMSYLLSANSWGIFVASADANYLEGWSSAVTTIKIEDITDKPTEYFGKSPNIIWQCRDGRVSSVQYPPQTKWAILESAKNQYDRVRLSIRKTTDGYFFLCHDTTINFLVTNPDGTDLSGSLVSPDGKTLAELNYYDWGHRFGSKWDGMKVPMLEDGLYYANLCNIAVTAELKFVPTQSEIDELWEMFTKYNVDKHLVIDTTDLGTAENFSNKSEYISFSLGGSIGDFRTNLERYNAIKNANNQIYYLLYDSFGTPPTDAEIAEVKSAGFATWYTPIFNKDTLFNSLGFAKGFDVLECANIPFIKSTVREYADTLIVWP